MLRDCDRGAVRRQSPDNVLVTHGAIGANALVHQALVEPGDRVVAIVPTYQQHYSIPESIGADVRILRLREEHGFLPDLDELRALAVDAKLIAFSNPNNPTGSLMDRAMLGQIAEIAARPGPTFSATRSTAGWTSTVPAPPHRSPTSTSAASAPAACRRRSPWPVCGSGWIIAPAERDRRRCPSTATTTPSVSAWSTIYFAGLALGAKDAILARSRDIVRGNLAILDEWVTTQPLDHYIKPRSGTTALLKYDLDVHSRELCVRLLEKTGVMLTPGSALDVEGYLRIGYANNPTGAHRWAGRWATSLTCPCTSLTEHPPGRWRSPPSSSSNWVPHCRPACSTQSEQVEPDGCDCSSAV